MEYVIAFPGKSLDTFICLEFFEANVALVEAKVSVPFKKHNGLDFPEVLIIIGLNVFKSLWQSMPVSCHNALLILNVVDYSSLHLEYAIFV